MTLVYRLNKSELEMRLTETQEQLKRVSEEMNLKASYDLMDTDKNSITTTRRTTNSSAQRRSMINGDYFLDFFKLKIYFNLKELKYFLFFSCQRQPSCISVVRSRFLIF